MASRKNAAREAAQAQPCPQSARPTWPTWQQAMHVSLVMVEGLLVSLTHACRNQRGHNARQFEVECAVELALAHIRRMQADPPPDHEAFEQQWRMAASAVQLADKAFKLPRSRYGRSLRDMRLHFDLLKDLVERVEVRGRRAA
ncbi:Uncharacterised protein [Delftia tsuruhatensis]|uniref:hypothetical protein n=1 Tax=Delftia tsuruhatensis TaxID=180282 RepID=UPI001E76D9B3|nr:hypothetical protein [Delftia tsuruhatensis]CAB5675817.1 Uncharacterised protein [Delftia tsuruhatensis]CAC9692711.1 Uncharacterised protein [Delftia tsuruhatensis]